MKIEYIKKGNNDIQVRIQITEDTYIEKTITKEETLKIFNNLKTILY